MRRKIVSLFLLILIIFSFTISLISCEKEKESENLPPIIQQQPNTPEENTPSDPQQNTEENTPSDPQPTPEENNPSNAPEAHTHTFVKVNAKAAGCEDNGNVEYFTCSGCDKFFSDASGKIEITLSQTVLPSTGHIMVGNKCGKCDYRYTEGLTYALNADKASYSLTGIGTATDLNIVIPTIYNSLPVTSISTGAFLNCTNITGITIPENITKIDDYAFACCYSLTEINFNATKMQDLKDYNLVFTSAGSNADGIRLTIGKNVTRIPAYLFCPRFDYNNPDPINIKTVEFEKDSSCEYIGEYAFVLCKTIEGVYVNNVTDWCKISFYDANSNPLTHAKKLYINSSPVTELVIPGNVKKINSYSFYNCVDITDLTIMDGVETIEGYAFLNCEKLENISIPDTIKVIKSSVFSMCTSVKTNEYNNGYYLGNSTNPYVMLIGLKNKTLTSFTVHNDTKIIDEIVFNDCTALENISLPDKLSYIGYAAFKGCNALSSIIIPESVGAMAGYVFEGCYALTIYCESEFKRWEWNTNWNYSKCPVVWNCKNNDVADDGYIYTVVNGIRYALKNNKATVAIQKKNIVTANISSTVAYKNSNYTVTQIISEAFYNCSSLTDVIIPDTVVTIGVRALVWCDNLKDVYYTGNEQSWVKISIGASNPSLNRAEVHFNYSAE